ncbi:MAG: hypothetical protein LC723_05970, partial [Actinobacteria bacterium]|nr:hypothetical protein [Actinomycetota bacterium]
EVASGQVTIDVQSLSSAGPHELDHRLAFGWNWVHGLLTPDLAFIFFYLGLVLLVLEALHPGISVPGVLGALSLATALAAFGMLPVQLLGIMLLIASVVFFLFELKHPGFGVHTVAGLICLVAGGLLLFDTAVPGDGVSPYVIGPVAVSAGLFFVFAVGAAMRARSLPKTTATERLIGRSGVVTTEIDPVGAVQVASERWSAFSSKGQIPLGAVVKVVASKGLRLEVEQISVESDELNTIESRKG